MEIKKVNTCNTCKEELDIKFFYVQKRDGVDAYYRGKCKMCYSKHRRYAGY
jgi:hypothetical protein